MYQLTLQIKPASPKQPKIIPGILTKRFHACILDAIRKQNPVLSSFLHQSKQRQQFSFYAQGSQIIVCSPNKGVIRTLQDHWQSGVEINLHHWKAIVQQVEARYLSLSEIKSKYQSSVNLRFLTPTTFYQDGNYYPLPELNRLLLSANKIYPMIDQPMLSLEQINGMVRQIRIEQVAIQSQRVHFGKFSIIGFQGKLELNLKALLPDEQIHAWMLFSLGALLGFGYKTAWGLGQTRLFPLES